MNADPAYGSILVIREARHLEKERELIGNLLSRGIAGVQVDFATSQEEAAARAAQADIILTSTFDWLPTVIAAAPKLKWLHFLSAGIDNVWTMPFDHGRYILSNSSSIHGVPMSEYVLAAMLHFAKNIPLYTRQKSAEQWNRVWLNELHGQCIGIVGLGSIGRAIAAKAKAFGMQVVGTVRNPRPIENVDSVHGPDEVDEVIRAADFLVLCAPLTAETGNLMSEARLRNMKSNAVLINIARGAMIDEAALVRVLKQGAIAGAALDAFEEEPLPVHSELWRLDNVLLTPHVAGTSHRGFERVLHLFIENYRLVVSGQRPRTAISRDQGY